MNVTASTKPASRSDGVWTSRAAATAIFAALAAALGYLLIGVPNVELLTFTVFAAGVVLGRLRGALVGLLAMGLYSGVNPYGSGIGLPTLFVAQLLAAAVAGLAGGSVSFLWKPGALPDARTTPHRGRVRREEERVTGRGRSLLATRLIVSAMMGFSLTVVYQVAVIVGVAAVSPEFRTGVFAILVANALFSVVHIVSNTVIFAVLGPAVLPRLTRLAVSRGHSAGPEGGSRR